jgi:pyrroloquinoline quinone (PQQ) biosynthesis protein C
LTPYLAIASLIVAMLSSPVTLFVAWLMRRDQSVRGEASESTVVQELERRVHQLETGGVSQRDFDSLSKRLDAIQTDLREIRNYQVNHQNRSFERTGG